MARQRSPQSLPHAADGLYGSESFQYHRSYFIPRLSTAQNAPYLTTLLDQTKQHPSRGIGYGRIRLL